MKCACSSPSCVALPLLFPPPPPFSESTSAYYAFRFFSCVLVCRCFLFPRSFCSLRVCVCVFFFSPIFFFWLRLSSFYNGLSPFSPFSPHLASSFQCFFCVVFTGSSRRTFPPPLDYTRSLPSTPSLFSYSFSSFASSTTRLSPILHCIAFFLSFV